MANSRLEKVGTIYSRTKGLIQAGGLHWRDRPLWYDLYEKFSPKEDPTFGRPKPNIPLKKIFYNEDKIRALFHKKQKNIGSINMFNTKTKTTTQKFIEAYKKVEATHKEADLVEQIYEEALDLLKRDQENKIDSTEEEQMSLARAFQYAQSKTDLKQETILKVNVKDIFKN